LDRDADWPQGPEAPLISLQPLSPEAMAQIVDNVLGTGQVAGDIRDRILDAANGNPLFVEQMLSMLIDEGTLRLEEGRWQPTVELSKVTVPPTIQALLTARLEQLEREPRAVVEPASVAGLRFAQDAVESLADERLRPDVGAQ